MRVSNRTCPPIIMAVEGADGDPIDDVSSCEGRASACCCSPPFFRHDGGGDVASTDESRIARSSDLLTTGFEETGGRAGDG